MSELCAVAQSHQKGIDFKVIDQRSKAFQGKRKRCDSKGHL